ncbi:hypothetical protein GQ457_12G018740 [Hibiscus cannabinus]
MTPRFSLLDLRCSLVSPSHGLVREAGTAPDQCGASPTDPSEDRAAVRHILCAIPCLLVLSSGYECLANFCCGFLPTRPRLNLFLEDPLANTLSLIRSLGAGTSSPCGTSGPPDSKVQPSRPPMLTSFALPWAHQGSGDSSRPHSHLSRLAGRDKENKLVYALFQEDKGSLLWVLAPLALISSLILPQFFLSNAIQAFFKNETLIVVSSFSFEVMFYVGFGMFLLVTDHVQRPYLQFSAKRWVLITGLRGYLTSSFLSMGFKVIAHFIAVYVTWPVLGIPTLVAVALFLAGCAVQFAFEMTLEKRQSLYQLTRATQYIQHFLLFMKDSPRTPELFERGSALIGMIGTFQALAVVCLWSLMTFLLRLFPSRLVSENY